MKGYKSNVESYRPISIQPVVSKLFERIVNDALRHHLKLLICDEQHGFFPTKSTTTNLLVYKDYITMALDDNIQIHSVYTDFHKAFDCVPHDLLLYKMSNMFGIFGDELRWFRTYLSDRKQRVVMGGIESDWTPVTSGVPQGSILGPSLFIMYINDAPSSLSNSKCVLYADDVKIYKRIACLADCLDFQRDLDSFSEWCCHWKLSLNFSKCFSMNFSLKRRLNILFDYSLSGNILHHVSEIKDLGVTFSSNLCFNVHITNVVNKALQMLGFIRRNTKHIKDSRTIKVLYNSYVRARLEYCSPVWSPSTKLWTKKIERVQKRFVRFLCCKMKLNYDRDKYKELCDFYNLSTLEHRRNVSDLLLFYKILHGRIYSFPLISAVSLSVPTRRTRRTNVFSAVKRRLLISKTSFIPRCVSLANSSNSVDFFDDSYARFKHSLLELTFVSLT